MSVTPDQKRAIDSIISIFETGRLATPAAYSTCTVLRDGAGISYGKHQATDKSGSLDLVCKKYIELGGVHAGKLQKYMPYLATNETSKVDTSKAYPMWMAELIALLKTAGTDPVMHRAQDEVFDANYWLPAVNICAEAKLVTPLAHAVVYDGLIHGGFQVVRNRFAAVPPAKGGDEKTWVKEYLKARRAWLMASANELLRRTVYRQDVFEALIAADNWNLTLPLTVRGVIVA
jgi:chitosanase